MSGTHDLLGLSFSAVWSAPQCPAFLVAHGVARVPEFGSYPRVSGSSDHFSETAVLDPVSFFAVELEVVPFLVDAPAVVGNH